MSEEIMENQVESGSERSETSESQETNDKLDQQTNENLPQSQSELDSMIGKAVNTALQNQQKKQEAAIQEAIEKERSYANMSEKERKESELDDRERQILKREAAIEQAELLSEVKADLSEKGLPVELGEILSAVNDKEVILEAVNSLKGYLDEAVAEGIKAEARQKSPGMPTREYGAGQSSLGIADFAQQNRIIKE